MQQALEGNEQSYHQFLTEISKYLRIVISKKINQAEVEDVLQEILISIHKARHTYDGKRPVLPWVYSIAKFRVMDYLRQHYANMQHQKVDIVDFENILEDVTEAPEDNEYINIALEALSPKQKQILTFMHVEGYTAKEIGRQISMNESAVKVAAHRAYKFIRENFKKPN